MFFSKDSNKIGIKYHEVTVRELRDFLDECLIKGIDGKVIITDDDYQHEILNEVIDGTEFGYDVNDLVLRGENGW